MVRKPTSANNAGCNDPQKRRSFPGRLSSASKTNPLKMWLNESQPLRGQVWHRAVLQVWRDDPQCVSWGLAFLNACQNHRETFPEGCGGEFAAHVKHSATPRSG